MVGFPDLALAPNAIISTTQDTGVPCRSPRGRRRGDRARLAGPGRGRRGRVDAGLPGPHASAWPSGCAADPGSRASVVADNSPVAGGGRVWPGHPGLPPPRPSPARPGPAGRGGGDLPAGDRDCGHTRPPVPADRRRGTWARQLVHGRLCLTSVPSAVGALSACSLLSGRRRVTYATWPMLPISGRPKGTTTTPSRSGNCWAAGWPLRWSAP